MVNKYEKFALELEKKLKNGKVEESKIKLYENNIKMLRLPGNDSNKEQIIRMMTTDFSKKQFISDYEFLNNYFMSCDNLDDEKRKLLIEKTLLLKSDSISNEKKEFICNELHLFKLKHSNIDLIKCVEDKINDKNFFTEELILEYTRYLDIIKNSNDLSNVNKAIAFLENNVYGFIRTKK